MIKTLQQKAADYLEENGISGDIMVQCDISEYIIWVYLSDIMANFVREIMANFVREVEMREDTDIEARCICPLCGQPHPYKGNGELTSCAGENNAT